MDIYFKVRTLTISSLFTKPRWSKPKLKPKLIIQGDWMQKAGFEIGEKVNITIAENKLIITKV